MDVPYVDIDICSVVFLQCFAFMNVPYIDDIYIYIYILAPCLWTYIFNIGTDKENKLKQFWKYFSQAILNANCKNEYLKCDVHWSTI